jgi:hypothetical protein
MFGLLPGLNLDISLNSDVLGIALIKQKDVCLKTFNNVKAQLCVDRIFAFKGSFLEE